MGEDVIGGRCPSWQAMVSVKNFHRSARARPPPADTQDESSAVTTSQVTPSTQDFAVSLIRERIEGDTGDGHPRRHQQRILAISPS
jgi:hypothetical protein